MRKTARYLPNKWRLFDLSKATLVDPNTIDNGSTTVAGVTTMRISDGAVTADSPEEGAAWYIPTGLVCTDLFDVQFVIEAVNAGAGGGAFGSAQADNIFTWMGITSDPADLLNRGAFIGREHAGAAQPRATINQGGVNQFGTGNAASRHVMGSISSPANVVKWVTRADCLVFNKGGVNGAGLQNGTTAVVPNSVSDPVYLVVAAGLAAPDTYEIPFKLWYKIGQRLPT